MRIFFAFLALWITSWTTEAVPLDVYIFPHTHLDVGWLQTWESYYYMNVSQMLPGIIDNLSRDPTKRFAWAETIFFMKWWQEDAQPSQKTALQQLLVNKQFEFVDGGLVQHDQALPTVYDIVSHMTDGVKFLIDTFGAQYRPTIGWSLDPFGATASNAALYGLAGYNALVLNRIPDADLTVLKQTKSLQFMWRGSASLNQTDSQIFTHVLDSYFCAPGEFKWSWAQSDGPPITKQNAQSSAYAFGSYILPRAAWFRTNQLFVPWGCDFQYENATWTFLNTDALMAEVNAHPDLYNYTMRYATPTEYFTVIHNSGVQFPVRDNTDFVPLVYNPSSPEVWSGYYSSRPHLKRQNRIALGAIQSANVAYILASKIPATNGAIPNVSQVRPFTSLNKLQTHSFSADSDMDLLYSARLLHSVALHHDAITGTMCNSNEGCSGQGQGAGDHGVLEDYLRAQAQAIADAENVLADATSLLLKQNAGVPNVFTVVQNREYGGTHFGYNTLVNKEFSVALMKKQPVALIIQNSLAWTRSEAINLQVPSHGIVVTDSSGAVIQSQTITGALYSYGRPIGGFPETFDQTLTFVAKVPPIGFTTYFLTPCQVSSSWPFNCQSDSSTSYDFQPPLWTQRLGTYKLSNDFFTLIADDNGPVSYYDIATGKNFSLRLNLKAYPDSGSDNGAYVFNPTGPSVVMSHGVEYVSPELQTNSLMDQLFIPITPQSGYYLRVYHTGIEEIDNQLELQFDIGLLDQDQDVVVEFVTDLSTNSIYTDGNAFELYRRARNDQKSTPENSWPQQSSVVMYDTTGKYELAILTEQGHALVLEQPKSSGTFQLMIARRLSSLQNGVPLDDKLDHTQKMSLLLGATTSVTRLRRSFLPRIQFPLRFVGSVATPSPQQWASQYRALFSAIKSDLPSNIHLFSLDPIRNEADNSISIILRLQHLYEKNEDDTYSQPVTINLSQIFSVPSYTITSLIEKTLIDSINKDQLSRWTWNTTSLSPNPSPPPRGKGKNAKNSKNRKATASDFIVTLNPLEIRTYQITFS